MQQFLLIGSLAMFAFCSTLHAQNTTPNNQQQQEDDDGVSDKQQAERFWEANVGEGQFMVSLGHITSVSRHQYILDGKVLVDEVTVDTNGSVPARFYFITPVTDEMRGSGIGASIARIGDRGKELVERGSQRTGTRVHEMVQKTYPHTSHAKQVEYRVLSAQVLGQLYGSVRTAWRTGRGRVFTVK